MELELTDIDKLPTNDMTTLFTMRYRLASDPDVDGSYTTVTNTKLVGSVIMPFLDMTALATGEYVLHTYYTSSGTTSGTKVTFEVTNPVLI